MPAAFASAVRLLPIFVQEVLNSVPSEEQALITEIRMRSERCISLSKGGRSFFLSQKGQLSGEFPLFPALLTHTQLQEVFRCLCRYSAPVYHEQIVRGFLPLAFGHRAGISGTAVYTGDLLEDVQNITSVNLRISMQQAPQPPSELLWAIHKSENGILIAGPPASGKTTLLRGILHAIDKEGLPFAVIDERGELAPVTTDGIGAPPPQNADFFSGYRKGEAMLQALRAMAPRFLICDEIGAEEDVRAIQAAVGAGVKTIATIHCGAPAELYQRPQAKRLLATGGFSLIVFLESEKTPGQIAEMRKVAL